MRVTRRDERGATAVIVAIMAVTLISMAAFAIDLGNAWQTRRNMVTATDAAALGAARLFATGGDGCSSAGAPSLLAANRSDATLDACTPNVQSNASGYVTVNAHTNASYAFAGLFGIGNSNVGSGTTAQWGLPNAAINLRPIALCLTSTPELEQWLNLPDGPSGPSSAPITINLSNAQPDACKDSNGNVAGNWGLAFGDGNNSNSDTASWLQNGYPTSVAIGSDIHANPGAFSGSIANALQTLEDTQTWFGLPVFDRVDGTNGNNAQYHVVAFVWVQLVAYQTSGSQAQRYITLNLDRGLLQGSCCGTGLNTGTRVIRICDVDALPPNSNQTVSSACTRSS